MAQKRTKAVSTTDCPCEIADGLGHPVFAKLCQSSPWLAGIVCTVRELDALVAGVKREHRQRQSMIDALGPMIGNSESEPDIAAVARYEVTIAVMPALNATIERLAPIARSALQAALLAAWIEADDTRDDDARTVIAAIASTRLGIAFVRQELGFVATVEVEADVLIAA